MWSTIWLDSDIDLIKAYNTEESLEELITAINSIK